MAACSSSVLSLLSILQSSRALLSCTLLKMLSSARFTRPLAIAGLTCFALLCLVSLGESLKVLSSASLAQHGKHAHLNIRRSWESEQGPFSLPRPQDDSEDEGNLVDHDVLREDTTDDKAAAGDGEKLSIPGLGTTLPAVNSIVASILGGVTSAVPVPGNPTQPIIPVSASGGIFGSVVSILAGAPSAVPVPGSPAAVTGSSGGVDSPLGGVLSGLSLVGAPTITAPPTVPTGSGGLLGGLHVLGGVASALAGVLGTPDNSNSNKGGLLGQLSADIVGPIASIAADPASILADPAAAINNLQSQVSSVLGNLPSAVAAGVQLANNVGGQIADALNATTDVLDSVPEVAGGVADQVGSLLHAAPNLATGLPAAALSAVSQVESILTAVPDLAGNVTGILSSLQDDLSSAVASAIPEVTSLAGVIGSQIVGILPSTLQPLVSGVLSTLQNDVVVCQVSDVVSGTAIIINVPCGQGSSPTSSPGAGPKATAPASVSASITVGETLPLAPTQLASTSPQLASILSSLSSSLISESSTAVPADATGTNAIAISALSGLSSLISQISVISLTAAILPSTQLAPPTRKFLIIPLKSLRCTDHMLAPASTLPGASSGSVEATTIYYVQTITALITSTTFQVSTVTDCPSVVSSFPSYTSKSGGSLSALSLPITGPTPSASGTTDAGPCPGQGYTCDDCLEGWFCPPVQTPALPAPCGYGWPCLHCGDGWFCVPSPQVPGAATSALSPSTSTTAIVIPKLHPATNGFQYAGCYADDSSRALNGSGLVSVAGGMTSGRCIDFCQTQGFILAGTEDGTQCFCGDFLIDSILLPIERCNATCAGDLSGSTRCGGSWALSVWSPDGTIKQVQSPEKQFTLPITSGHYHPGGVRVSRISKETAIYVWPPHAAPASTRLASTSLGVADLGSSILAAVASEAIGLATIEPASASAIVQSVSSLLNSGMSSIANSLAVAAAIHTAGTLMTGPSGLPLGPGPVVPSTTIVSTAAPLVAEVRPSVVPTTTAAGSEPIKPSAAAVTSVVGSSGDNTSTASHGGKAPMAFGPKNERRAHRRKAHRA